MKPLLCFLILLPALVLAEKPNVIYILADDLGYGDLSCYGQTKLATPNIDRLAGEGLKFTNHYAGNTVCSPSRACLMLGVHPGHCHIQGNTGEDVAALDPDSTTLPEIFKQAGYATGAFGKWGLGHPHLPGKQNPLTHGFDTYSGWKSQTIAHTYFPSSIIRDGHEVPLEKGTYIHTVIMDDARSFIARNADAKTPFFCYIPTAIPHAAMHAPAELHEKWRKKFPQFDDRTGKYGTGPEDCPDVVNPIAGFAAMMEQLDSDVGSILDLLKEKGIDSNTLVMFSSDNGAHLEGGHDPVFWNSTGGLRGHKRDMHEGGIRVPLLARWPGVITPGRKSDLISAHWDLFPTVAEMLGVEQPEGIDGLSFLPTLQGREEEQQKHGLLYWEFRKDEGRRPFSQAIRQESWKAYREQGKPLEVFNLAEDPFEEKDLAGDLPDKVAEFKKLMSEMQAK